MPRRSPSLSLNLILIALLLIVGIGAIAVGAALYSYSLIADTLPSPSELQDRANTFKTTAIYDRDGNLLYEIFPNDSGRRTLAPIASVSPHLINATFAVEDPNFYYHPGVDPVGVARAFYYVLRNDDRNPGGSGIPQQLVKLTFLSAEKSYTRKIQEAVLALEISRRYSKDDILEIYLNHIFYGNLSYGAEAAAQTYFDKSSGDLTLAEASLLAGIPQYPGLYDPYSNWEATRNRQADVLRLMVEHGFVTAGEATSAWMMWEGKGPDDILAFGPGGFPHAHFVLMVRQQLEDTYGSEVVSKGGLRVITTLDADLQRQAEQAVREGLENLAEQNANAGTAALVAMDPDTGEILALVGSSAYEDAIAGQINMAVLPRQTGSVIKPFAYLATFEKVEDYWTPATMILDEKTEFPDAPGRPPYVPKNYDGKFHGPVSMRSALANSYNIPAVKALQHAGVPALLELSERVGVTSLTRPDYGLSLTLGGGEVSPVEMTGAFAALANGGYRVSPHVILQVETVGGDLLEDHSRPLRQIAIAPEHTYLITSILSDTGARRPAFGNLSRLLELPDRPVAAKTGTTDDWRDGWTVGYTPDLVTGVWVGNADNTPMNKLSGVRTAAPIWKQFMQQAHEGRPVQSFQRPSGVADIEICVDTGAPPTPDCPQRRQEIFKLDQPPLAPTIEPAPTETS